MVSLSCDRVDRTITCSAGEVRNVLPSVAAVEPSSSDPAPEAVASL